jgi:transposase
VPAPRKHPDELRERAIRFALDLVEGPEKLSVNAARKRVGEQLGIIPDTLQNWIQRQRIDAGAAPGLTTDERTRLRELEREVTELRRPRRCRRYLPAGPPRPPVGQPRPTH